MIVQICYFDLIGNWYVEFKWGEGKGVNDLLLLGGFILLFCMLLVLDLDVLIGGFKLVFWVLDFVKVNNIVNVFIIVFQG